MDFEEALLDYLVNKKGFNLEPMQGQIARLIKAKNSTTDTVTSLTAPTMTTEEMKTPPSPSVRKPTAAASPKEEEVDKTTKSPPEKPVVIK